MTSRTSLSSKKLQYECSINTIELLIYYPFNCSLKRKIPYQNNIMLQVKQRLALMESL